MRHHNLKKMRRRFGARSCRRRPGDTWRQTMVVRLSTHVLFSATGRSSDETGADAFGARGAPESGEQERSGSVNPPKTK